MTTKFYSATDGKITVFRANASGRNYQSALKLRNGISFSATPANLMEGAMPAVEITKAEYQALVALKTERLKAAGGKGYTKPSDSWVSNASLPATKALGNTEKLGAAIQAIADEKKAAKAKARSDAKKARNANPLGHAIAAIKQAAKAPAKAAKAPTGTAKAAQDAKAPTGNRAVFVKLLLRTKGATRQEMQEAAGSKTMPSSNDLTVLADRLGYELYADTAPRADTLVYQFVRPGAAATAY